MPNSRVTRLGLFVFTPTGAGRGGQGRLCRGRRDAKSQNRWEGERRWLSCRSRSRTGPPLAAEARPAAPQPSLIPPSSGGGVSTDLAALLLVFPLHTRGGRLPWSPVACDLTCRPDARRRTAYHSPPPVPSIEPFVVAYGLSAAGDYPGRRRPAGPRILFCFSRSTGSRLDTSARTRRRGHGVGGAPGMGPPAPPFLSRKRGDHGP